MMDTDDLRNKALTAYNRHKKGWIGLGEVLVEINISEKYKEWGHDNFKQYCTTEVGVPYNTAKQMMQAYEYIKNNEPSMLNTIRDNDDSFVPEFSTICALQKANKKIDNKEITDNLHSKLFDPNSDYDEAKQDIKDALCDADKKDGNEIMDEIRSKTKKIKNKFTKIVNEINSCSSFDTDIQELAESLNEKIQGVSIQFPENGCGV